MVRAGDVCERGCGRPKKQNGNCPMHLAADGLPLQCVGPWAMAKHDYLRRYIDATAGPRSKYVGATPSRPRPGGAAFIDLFAGPGLARVDRTGEVIEGSPLIAAAHSKAPFTSLILCEIDEENVAALERRLASDRDRVHVVHGDTVANINHVAALVPPYGLNFALVDPFGPSCLRWSALEALGRMPRMDLLVHFPTGSLKRNFHNIDDFGPIVGTDEWRHDVHSANDVPRLVDHLRRSLERVGYTGAQGRAMAIENDQHGLLYHLVFASKNPLGDKIWSSIVKTEASGQRNLF